MVRNRMAVLWGCGHPHQVVASMSNKMLTQVQGHPVYPSPEGWRYVDTEGLVVEESPRQCVQCLYYPSWVDGIGWVDHCFVRVFFAKARSCFPEGVTWACCGHGVEDGYIRWGNLPDHTTDAVLT